jgi:hypothetical protein
MTSTRRTATTLTLALALLTSPLTAAPLEKSPISLVSLLSSLWERVTAPWSGILEKDDSTEGRLHIDPDGATTDEETTERRLHIDPNG